MNHYAKREEEKPLFVRIMYWCICLVLLFMFLLLFWVPMNAQERSNTYYAAQFEGADAGTKITKAQASCSPNTAIICTIVIDAILSGWPQGTDPAKCSNCVWMDYRQKGMMNQDGISLVGNSFASALLSSSGETWTPPGYRETFTSQINIGSSTSPAQAWLHGNNLLTCNVTSGDCLDVHNGSFLRGVTTGSTSTRTGGSVLNLSPSATVVNVVAAPEGANVNGQSFFGLEDLQIDNANLAAVSGAFVNLTGVLGLSSIKNVNVSQCNGVGFKVGSTSNAVSGPLTLDNDWADCAANVGGQPLLVQSTPPKSTASISIVGGAYVHPGANVPAVTFDGQNSGNVLRNIFQANSYLEDFANNNNIGTKIVDAGAVTIVNGEANMTGTGVVGVDISETTPGNTKSVLVLNYHCAGANIICIKNHITGTTLGTSSAYVPLYYYGGTGGTQSTMPWTLENFGGLKFDSATGQTYFSWIPGASFVYGNGAGVEIASLSSAGLWKATSFGTETNCTSTTGACSSAPAGAVTIAAAATTVTVSTTAVTANSEIYVQETPAYSTRLSVTCNSTTGRTYTVTTITAGTSFVITASAAPTTNPACLSFNIVN